MLFRLAVICAFLCPGATAPAQMTPASAERIEADIYGNVYLLDVSRNTLRVIPPDRTSFREIGGPGWENGRFDTPRGIWARNGLDLLVADEGNHRIQRFDRTLTFVSSLSTRESDNAYERFGYPKDVALSRMGDLFLIDGENVRILKFTGQNRFERSFGGPGGGKGRLTMPRQLDLGARDEVYVLDDRRVALFDAFGNYLTDLGEGRITAPEVLYADDRGAIVSQSDSLLLFDPLHVFRGALPASRCTEARTLKLLDVAASGDTVFLLTGEGVFPCRDPRGEFLDKESKSP